GEVVAVTRTGDHLPGDATGRTDVPGVWAAGNVTDIAAQVGGSAVAGGMAAAQINADLAEEDTALAVEVSRYLAGSGKLSSAGQTVMSFMRPSSASSQKSVPPDFVPSGIVHTKL